MPLYQKLKDSDGWYRTGKEELHFVFNGKSLCGETIPADAPRDNVREQQCQKCFERVRNLYNFDSEKDLRKDH